MAANDKAKLQVNVELGNVDEQDLKDRITSGEPEAIEANLKLQDKLHGDNAIDVNYPAPIVQ
ncbi:hypothetical protein CVD28_20055 [Bacillus sp. M6-12]|uniref:hypothetical protein n=1 Tax=Bacillus sp. M6-12 TaxID=2054166 RepID=UPI000C788053|nr:hypothetical protein [Bacillus sp. M6-12]PLS15812.1 hypothetical protein CVD28_20055 [Bacillus sp. M6-12]